MKKYTAHTRYKNQQGQQIPGTTTVLGILNKPALVPWAWNLGMQKIDYKKFVDEKAEIGTLSHYMVERHILKKGLEQTVMNEYSASVIKQAEQPAAKFLEWEKENNFELIGAEMLLVSEKHQFGGQCDIYCNLNGKKTLIDLKTSKAVFSEMHTQVVAYSELLKENGYEVEDIRILRIGRDEAEGFEDIKISMREEQWRKFLLCLEIYQLNKLLK